MRLTTVLYLFFISVCYSSQLSITTENFDSIFKFPDKKLVLAPKDPELELLLLDFSKPQEDEIFLSLFVDASKPKVSSLLKDEKSGKAYKNLIADISSINPVLLIIEDDRNFIAVTRWNMKSGQKFFHLMCFQRLENKLMLAYKSFNLKSSEFLLTEALSRDPDLVSTMKIISTK